MKNIEGIWYNPKLNELIEISLVSGIHYNCVVTDYSDSEYYNISLGLLKVNDYVRIGCL